MSTSAHTADADEPLVVVRRVATIVVTCSGDLDIASGAELEQRLQVAAATAPETVVVDLENATFFDAGTIGVFVATRNALRAAGGDLALRSPSRFARHVLAIVGLDELVEEASSSTTWIAGAERTESLAGQIGAQSRAEVKIDQAAGLIAAQFGLTIAASTSALSHFAQLCDQPVRTVARDLIDGTRTIDEVRTSIPGGLLGPTGTGTAVAEDP